MNRIVTILLLSLFCSASADAAYDGHWYKVEIIIFAHNNSAALREEYWPPEPGLPDMSGVVSLTTGITDSEQLPSRITGFEQLPMQMLKGALSRLQGSNRYRIIHATAWKLPGLSQTAAPPLRIQAGHRHPLPTTVTSLTQGTHAQPIIRQQAIDSILYEIDGRIKISLSKYLNVDTDLLFHNNILLPNPDGVPVQSLRTFRLTEFRRMKSNTVHYLDHPIFGVVIGIDRL